MLGDGGARELGEGGMTCYKCTNCLLILNADDLIDGLCPVCESKDMLKEMCPNDHCHCPHDKVGSIAYCELCGAAMCPVCKCHDVSQISRVTGYMSDVAGWGAAKRQELKDRKRYDVT